MNSAVGLLLKRGSLRGFRGSTEVAGSAGTSLAPARGYPPAPLGEMPPRSVADAAAQIWVRRVVDTVNIILRGKLNATTLVTFAADADSTTFNDPRLSASSVILLMPTSSSAAGADGQGWYVAAQTNGSAIISHANSALTDRTYRVLIIG